MKLRYFLCVSIIASFMHRTCAMDTEIKQLEQTIDFSQPITKHLVTVHDYETAETNAPRSYTVKHYNAYLKNGRLLSVAQLGKNNIVSCSFIKINDQTSIPLISFLSESPHYYHILDKLAKKPISK